MIWKNIDPRFCLSGVCKIFYPKIKPGLTLPKIGEKILALEVFED
jgi:hypothetical protein